MEISGISSGARPWATRPPRHHPDRRVRPRYTLGALHVGQPSTMKRLATITILLITSILVTGQVRNCSTGSCLSFRARVARQDPEILDKLASSMAYVCFYERDDKFLIANYNVPHSGLYSSREQVKDETTPRLFEVEGTATVAVYDGPGSKPLFGVPVRGTCDHRLAIGFKATARCGSSSIPSRLSMAQGMLLVWSSP